MFLSNQNKIRWHRLTWVTLVVAILVVLGIFWIDKPIAEFMRQFNCWLFRMFQVLFDAWTWLFVFGIAMLYVYVIKTFHSWNEFKCWIKSFKLSNAWQDFITKMKTNNSFLVFCSVLIASVTGQILKFIIGRVRPDYIPEGLELFGDSLQLRAFIPMSMSDWYHSMPSGHAIATFAGLVMIGMLKPKYKWLTWVLAILVGLSRLALARHWFSDVLFGAFIGMVVADFVLAFARKK